ncbi:MAG: putative glycosyltransferase YkoT [Lentisphaerae bacterium ADurb.Bin082]|nr:MAG: putative glycosyltransferase YkoT [Lentisphaerae bacterium ADurb.Bin082]
MSASKILSIVVPCYNEESILANSIEILAGKIAEFIAEKLVSPESFLLCVDDGSSDRTWDIIRNVGAIKGVKVVGLRLSGNRGHQCALWAGLEYAATHSDAAISIDADLQDDINVLRNFVNDFNDGADIVYGVRNDRTSDSWAKRVFAEGFYKMMQWLGVKTIYNHADFRLMSKRAIQALMEYREVNLYIRGLVPLLGFRQAIVLYARKAAERPTHYSIAKMLRLAWDGITSFSVRPIRLVSIAGGDFCSSAFATDCMP